MNNTKPIGLFDSGIGGTSIWREIHQLLPNENTIFLADNKNTPYGQKTKEEIIYLSFKNTEYLLEKNCKLIVVACNTATTNAIKELRQKYDVPFIGIEPAIKPAANNSKTQIIGVLATKGTLNSELFSEKITEFSNTQIIEQMGDGLVRLIEEGNMESDQMTFLLNKYLTPMVKANIDYLVLGCTHYPYLLPQIKKIVPNTIKIIDSSVAVAKQTQQLLYEKKALNPEKKEGSCLFYVNAKPDILVLVLENKYAISVDNF